MRGLLLRLSDLDPDAGASLRVIEYFDQLTKNGASLEAVTRASAALGCCTAGLRDKESGRVVRFDGGGQALPPLMHSPVIEAPVVIGDETVGYVWLERDKTSPLDEMLVERMAVTAAARWRPFAPTAGVDPALVELVIGSGVEEQDRARALRLLGLSPKHEIRAVAVSVSTGDLAPFIQSVVSVLAGEGAVARATALGMTGAVLVQGRKDVASALSALHATGPPGVRMGVGRAVPAVRAAESWASARVAARFASAWAHKSAVVAFDDLGSLALLASVPHDESRSNPDVQALASLSRAESGAQDIGILLAVTWHGSARRTAEELHMHHSSVTNRLRHIEAALGMSFDDPAGRLRAQIAVLLWSLLPQQGFEPGAEREHPSRGDVE